MPATSPVEEFYARYFDNEYMAHRFESMTITPEDSTRVDTAGELAAADIEAEGLAEQAAAALAEDSL